LSGAADAAGVQEGHLRQAVDRLTAELAEAHASAQASEFAWQRKLEAAAAEARAKLMEERSESEDALQQAAIDLAEAQAQMESMKVDLALGSGGSLSPGEVDGDAYDELRSTMEELATMQAEQEEQLHAGAEERDFLRGRVAQLEADLQLALEAAGADVAEGTPAWAGFYFARDDLINLRAFVRWHNGGEMEQTPEQQLEDWRKAEATVLALQAEGASDEDLFRIFRAEAAPFLAMGDTRPFNPDALRLIARMVDPHAAGRALM